MGVKMMKIHYMQSDHVSKGIEKPVMWCFTKEHINENCSTFSTKQGSNQELDLQITNFM